MPNPYLIVESGPDQGSRHDIKDPECVMGRHPDCQVVIEVGAVSRHHAQIVSMDGKHFIEDLNSRNGTFLNDEAIQGRRLLDSGDQLRICDVLFTFNHPKPDVGSDGSSFGQLVVDDGATSTIMTKLDVSSNRSGPHLSASADMKLAAMLETTQSLGKAVALDDVLPKVLDSLFKIFIQADRGFIILKDEKGTLIPRWSKLRRVDADDTLRISQTIVEEVIDSKKAILSADAATDTRFDASQSVAEFRIRSMMCTPLVNSEGEAIGVLQIDTLDQRKRFEHEDLEVLSSVAAQAAVAIDNAQLHENALRQRAVERDLELAREVQRSFLPDHRPDFGDVEFFDYYRPASHIGGDYYDYIRLPDGKLAILVADVVGHGVAAAMLMAKLSAEARYALASEASPAAAITRLNEQFCKLHINRFATLILVAIDPATYEMSIVNCGHMPPIIRRQDGSIEEPGSEHAGIPVGINDDVQYRQFTTTLHSGEIVMLYTDGVNEAMNEENECYTIERIRQFVCEQIGSLHRKGQLLIDDVRQHIGDGTQDDDMCLVLFARGVAFGDADPDLKQTLQN